MTISTYQFAFTTVKNSSGTPTNSTFTFGAGTPWIVESVDGLAGTSKLRVQDDNRGYIDGSYSGRDFYDSRTVTFEILILGDSSNTAQQYYKQLQAALAPQVLGYYPDQTLSTQSYNTLGLFQFQLTAATGIQRMWGRVRSIETLVDPDFTYGYIMTKVEFYFPDPRYYDDSQQSISSGTSVSLSNTGWATTCPTITIASPSASGAIWDTTSGSRMNFANVNTSQPLVIDFLQRSITQNGIAARNTLVSFDNTSANGVVQGWLSVAPNTSSVTWSSTIGSMSVILRNAYV